MTNKRIRPALAVAALALGLAVLSCPAAWGQATAIRKPVALKVAPLQVTNYILRLPDAYIVCEPAGNVFQIAALGAVLSYGEDWERRQVKPYLFHLKHKSWVNHFWKVNTSRREVYLVWGGLFGRIGATAGSGQEVDGGRLDVTVDVVGGSDTQAPERYLIRFAEADLYFDPAAGDLRLDAAGTTLSPCDQWEACALKEFLFHIRLKTWKDFFWKVNTSRMEAWWTKGADFCKLGGEDEKLDLAMTSVQRPFTLARLRTKLATVERAKLNTIARMIEAGRPLADIHSAAAEFVRDHPGVDTDTAVTEIAGRIKALEAALKEFKKKRAEMGTSFENFDQKTNQLFNILSTVLKTMKETQSGITRNLL
jgi:hypothetical protein